MSFEPCEEKCSDRKTKRLCPLYKGGNGDDFISGCKWEQSGAARETMNPPDWCPMYGDFKEYGHTLAMLVLQSDLYKTSYNVKQAVDSFLAMEKVMDDMKK